MRSNQLSTLRPRERAPANLAGAGAMESCAMTLRGCPSLGTRSPVQASVPGELSAAVPQRRVLMRPTLAWDQWQRPGCRRHHRGVVRSPWDTRTRWLFYYVKEVVTSVTTKCHVAAASARLEASAPPSMTARTSRSHRSPPGHPGHRPRSPNHMLRSLEHVSITHDTFAGRPARVSHAAARRTHTHLA